MVDIAWTCSKQCGWEMVSKTKPCSITGGCKCGGKFITKRKAKKKAWKAKIHEIKMKQNKKASLNREISRAVNPKKSVKDYLKEE